MSTTKENGVAIQTKIAMINRWKWPVIAASIMLTRNAHPRNVKIIAVVRFFLEWVNGQYKLVFIYFLIYPFTTIFFYFEWKRNNFLMIKFRRLVQDRSTVRTRPNIVPTGKNKNTAKKEKVISDTWRRIAKSHATFVMRFK